MPKLVFDDDMVNNVSSGAEELNRYKLVNAIFHVLMLHRGPIVQFCLQIANKKFVKEIDQIILHASWSKNLKAFTFDCATDGYKLPFSLFSMQKLERLQLTHCEFELPLTYNGFSMLNRIIFMDVTITANTLQRFLTNCPLLVKLCLIENGPIDFVGGNEFTFVDLFKCLPSSIRLLQITKSYMEHFSAGGMPQKLPTPLPQLKFFILEVCLQKQDELLSTLCVINSSPNLEVISMEMFCNGKETFNNLLDLQDHDVLND